MLGLEIKVIAGLSLARDGELLTLPASRKTRALLAYLVVTARPHRRDRLCELFWEAPDDPRGSLRWSLSKLRALVNDADADRIVADRERAGFVAGDANVDLHRVRGMLQDEGAMLELDGLRSLERQLGETLLDGVDLPDHEDFQAWLEAEREQLRKLRGRVTARLAQHPSVAADQAAEYAQRWLALDPYSHAAASCAVIALRRVGRATEAAVLARALIDRHRTAGRPWQPPAPERVAPSPAPQEVDSAEAVSPNYVDRQSIHFCTAPDGVRIAYATLGQGSTVVKAANWLSHLELDWNAPIWSPLFHRLAREHFFVRYD